VTFTTADENPDQFKSQTEIDEKTLSKITETSLISALEYGIGIIHDGLTSSEISTVKRLYDNKIIRLLVIS
jgi:replicative superfamily II helicase